MKQQGKKVTALLLAFLVVVIGGIAFYIAGDSSVEFKDANLENAIREELGNKEGPIRREDLERLDELNLGNNGIESLEGIENAFSIRDLNLEGNRIKDITPLEDLMYLEHLSLSDNRIEDASVISDLKRLTTLDLRNTGLEDLQPVTELVDLTQLNVRGNSIKSLEPLQDLTQLQVLNVRNNQIDDISTLSQLTQLEDVNLRNNRIEDFTPILELPYLNKRLYVEGNPGLNLRDFIDMYERVEEMDIDSPDLAVVFSESGGVFQDSQLIELEQLIGNEGVIRYTLDGSEPTEKSNEYTNPLKIDETTVVKARFYDRYGNPGEMVANTYFIQEDSTLPVISLSGNPEDFFGKNMGIYSGESSEGEETEGEANYLQSGELWEREATIEIYKQDGEPMIHQQAGVRLHGNASRNYPKKSFRLYARSDYDTENTFNYPIFGEGQGNEFNRLILRNSGNDWNETLFRDAFLQELISGFDVEKQAYQPANLYINGDYWGIYNIRERIDDDYFEFKYGILEEDLEYLENNSNVRVGDNRHYNNMLEYIEHNDITDPQVYAQVKEQMDINNYIDYNIAQIYTRNLDWPANNVRYWREKPQGKWRWTVFDLDFGFGLQGVDETAAHHTLNFATEKGNQSWPNPDWATFLFRTLLENEEFKTRFIGSFSHYLNTHFNEERVVEVLTEFEHLYEPEMRKNIQRWEEPESYQEWEKHVEVLREFGEVRKNFMLAHLVDYFDLSGYSTLNFKMEDDSNSVEVYGKGIPFENGEWSGIYTSDTPLEIRVNGKPAVLSPLEGNEDVVDENGRLVTSSSTSTQVSISNNEGEQIGSVSIEGKPVEKKEWTIKKDQEINWQQELENNGEYAVIDNEDLGSVEGDTFVAGSAGQGLLTVHNEADEVVAMAHVNIIHPASQPRVYNDGHPSAQYEGYWERSENEQHYRETASYSSEQGSQVTITFEGTGIQLYGYRGPTQGVATIEVDGNTTKVDTYDEDSRFHNELFAVEGLEYGEHTMTITVSGERNQEALDQRIHIDGFEVLGE